MITYTTNEYGLRTKDMEFMLGVFAAIPSVGRVVLYGSRAKGSFEKGSDVDLAITGSDITHKDIAHIHFMLENESPTLLWFDVLHYDTLTNAALKAEIDKYGREIYSK